MKDNQDSQAWQVVPPADHSLVAVPQSPRYASQVFSFPWAWERKLPDAVSPGWRQLPCLRASLFRFCHRHPFPSLPLVFAFPPSPPLSAWPRSLGFPGVRGNASGDERPQTGTRLLACFPRIWEFFVSSFCAGGDDIGLRFTSELGALPRSMNSSPILKTELPSARNYRTLSLATARLISNQPSKISTTNPHQPVFQSPPQHLTNLQPSLSHLRTPAHPDSQTRP